MENPSTPKYLDTGLLLLQLGDSNEMHSMLTLLAESLTRDVPLVSTLLENNDVVEANRILHPLKGFIPIFCGTELCSHVAKVEELSKIASAAEVRPAYALLRPELEQLAAEALAYVSNHGKA
jgi:hypothetical protein